MKIRTRLKISSWFLLGLVGIVIGFTAWSLLDLKGAEEERILTRQMRLIVFERSALRDEYLLLDSERARMEWWLKTEALSGYISLAAGRFCTPAERQLISELRSNFDATKALFRQLEKNRRPAKRMRSGAPFSEGLERKLVSKNMLASYALRSSVDKLRDSTIKSADAARRRTIYIFILSFVALMLVVFWNSIFVNHVLSGRIAMLQDGVDIIGRGNLDFRFNIPELDELCAVARSIDDMLARLQHSLTSIENLEKEIAERRLAEESLKKTMGELGRSNKELEQFAYIASHDLQEPLRTISSYVQLLEKRYKGKFDQDADDFIHFIIDGAGRMQKMISDLLHYSRVGTKARPFEKVACDIILQEVLSNLQVKIEDAGAIITHGPLPVVKADPSQLVQVFQNLIANALEFRGEKASEIHVSAERKGNEWVFSVRDNGIGFDPQYAEKIFDIFKRLHTQARHPGSGIGLAICRRIMERHGGRIWAESGPDQGAVFYFTLPTTEVT